VAARLLRLLTVLVMALACCGCARDDEVIELTQWTLVTPAGTRRPVTLPGRFATSDLDARSHVVLETVTHAPEAWNRMPLSLALVNFGGDARLTADGAQVPAIDVGASYSWTLGNGTANRSDPSLTLDLDEMATQSPVAAPRLSATTAGDAAFRSARDSNFLSSVVAIAIGTFLVALYAVLYLLDRRRTAHAWFALQAAATLPAAATHTGFLRLVAPWGIILVQDAAIVGCVAALGFVRSYFERSRLRPAWLAGALVLTCLSALSRSAQSRVAALDVLMVVVLAAIAWMFVTCVRQLRGGRDRFAAMALGAGWLLLSLAIVPDIWTLLTRRELLGGVRGIEIACILFWGCQALVLGRDHIRSLREAEARVTEVEQLNDELRRQVAERSRELTEALARSEGNVAPASLDAGDVFDGRYRVTRALGRGGMGAVYEVERTRDGRKFALKVVTGAMSAKHAARFAREAEIGARLQHENLVSIVDVGIATGATPFLVMELVQGGSLEDKRTRFGDAAWARPIVRQIAAGLAELHANRIVHRDLKPGNVLLVENGSSAPSVAKISDFGISRFGALDDSADVDAEGATAHPGAVHAKPRDLTETGAIMGTPVYMPPEAWFGPARHPSADVFSLGVLAYEALTGRSPFPIPPVLLVRARQPIPTPAPLDGIDANVASLVVACLCVEPSERPRAKEIAEALG
jgi:hypothetical protein